MRTFLFLLVTTLFSLGLTGCTTTSKKEEVVFVSPAVTVMTYNVENLFDTKDDPSKEDETYLPLVMKSHPRVMAQCMQLKKRWWREECLSKDWNEDLLRRKMQRLADVILQVNQGRGPDILILPEVENKEVLERLRKEHLSQAGYQEAILIEGPDRRGIDVGLLSRLPSKGKAKLHLIEFKEDEALGVKKEDIHPTRGILEATLQLPDKRLLTVLGVHFPSQGSPTGFRKQAISRLNEVAGSFPEDRMVIVGGDFNITIAEEIDDQLYTKDLGQNFAIAQQLGCQNCRGTHYYHRKRSWSFLDSLLFSEGLKPKGNSPWVVVPSSISVPNNSLYQRNRWGSPARFGSGRRKTGVSDHWPLVATLIARPKKIMISGGQEKKHEDQ